MSTLDALTSALRCLPGVGVKSAQRMAYHLMQHDRNGALQLAQALTLATQRVRHCSLCHTFTEDEVCATCADPQRNRSQLCVVETPADQAALERTGAYKGRYFVLMGRLSPLDGIGPQALGLDLLERRLAAEQPVELVIATNPTVEGDATAHYIGQLATDHGVKASRLAQGIPSGGELEHLDSRTLASSLAGRRPLG